MNRALALLAAATCAALAISSAGFAADWTTLPFQLAKTSDAGRVKFCIQHRQDGQRPGNWSQSAAMTGLEGLGANPFMARNAAPIRYTLVRPAGRFDCIGSVRSSEANGRCNDAANAAFSAMLVQRGLGRPSLERGQ